MTNYQGGDFYRLYKLAYRDKNIFLKTSLLSFLTLLLFVAGSMILVKFLLVGKISFNLLITDILCWILGLSSLIIFYLISSPRDFFIWNTIFSLSFVPFLLAVLGLNWLVLAVFLIILIVFLLGGWLMRLENNSLLTLNWIRIINRGITFPLLGITILLFFLIGSRFPVVNWENYLQKYIQQFNFQIPFLNFNNLNLSGTVDDFLKSYLQTTTPRNIAAIKGAEEILLKELKKNLSDVLKTEISGKEKSSDFIISFLQSKWRALSSFAKMSFIIVFLLIGLSLFNIAKIVVFIVVLLTFWVMLQILISLQYLKIEKINTLKSILVIT